MEWQPKKRRVDEDRDLDGAGMGGLGAGFPQDGHRRLGAGRHPHGRRAGQARSRRGSHRAGDPGGVAGSQVHRLQGLRECRERQRDAQRDAHLPIAGGDEGD